MAKAVQTSLLAPAGTKGPFSSMGIVGPSIGAVSGIVAFAVENWEVISSAAGSVWALGSLLFAAGTGIWGRWRATRRIATPGILK